MTDKTWKRETAILVLLWVIYVSIHGSVQALSIIVWPAFLFIGAAFGMEWAKKTGIVDRINIGKG